MEMSMLGTGTLLDVDRDYGARPGVVEEPDPAILDNDLAQDTERVTVGSLAVGDTVWLDQNRNGSSTRARAASRMSWFSSTLTATACGIRTSPST